MVEFGIWLALKHLFEEWAVKKMALVMLPNSLCHNMNKYQKLIVFYLNNNVLYTFLNRNILNNPLERALEQD